MCHMVIYVILVALLRKLLTTPSTSRMVEDGDVEAIYDLLSAEPPGRDSAQDQSRGGACRIGGTPPKLTVVSVKVARAADRTRT
jgi:hypothetical protein